ncbi:MAG: hypothetical protein ABIN36_09295 [Ferruginibacter sp.]
MKNYFILLIILFAAQRSLAQNIVKAEYFIDTDAGVGYNNSVNLVALPDGSFPFTANISSVTPGYHKLYIRTKDSDGNWSMTTSTSIEVVPNYLTKKIVSGEYFIDVDPGVGMAEQININPQDSAIFQNFNAVTSSLSPGFHQIYIRMKDNAGSWSHTIRRNLEIVTTNTYVIAAAEYFFNNDPGIGMANPVSFSSPAPDGNFSFSIPVENIPVGAHTLYIRAKDSSNHNLSITQWQRDSVVTTIQAGLWSQPATWSNNKIPDSNTVIIMHHDVIGDINGFCKSLYLFDNTVHFNVLPGKIILVTGTSD